MMVVIRGITGKEINFGANDKIHIKILAIGLKTNLNAYFQIY